MKMDTACIPPKKAIVSHGRLKASPAFNSCLVRVVLLAVLLAAAGCGYPYVTRIPDAHKPLVFPADHGGHDDAQWEWWYYNGRLVTDSGQTYDYFCSFFKVYVDGDYFLMFPMQLLTLPLPMYFPFLFGGFSILDHADDRYVRDYVSILPLFWIGDYAKGELSVRLGKNKAWREDDNTFRVQAAINGYEIDLSLTPEREPLLYGKDRNGTLLPPQTVHRYYSYTRMRTQGTLKKNQVTEQVHGESWMDHEYGLIYHKDFQSWDWIGMTLDNGMDVVCGVVHYFSGDVVPQSFCTIRFPDGHTAHLEAGSFSLRPLRTWKSPQTRTTFGIDWEIRVPAYDLLITAKALKDKQEMFVPPMVVWEGPCAVQGSYQGQPVAGRAFLETWGDYQVPLRRLYRSQMKAAQ